MQCCAVIVLLVNDLELSVRFRMSPLDREQGDQRGEENLCSIDPDSGPEAADRELHRLHISFSHTP